MLDSLKIKENMYKEEYKQKRNRYKIITIFAAIVVFIVTYALIIPAFTWEKTLICDAEEHIHNEKCYDNEDVLVCQKKEHSHNEDCYDAPKCTDKTKFCGKSEHTHSEGCYFSDGELKCTIQEHSHNDYCYSGTFLVDYYFGEKEYHQDGFTTILLSDLFKELGINKNTSDIDKVTFTDEELIEINEVELENGSIDWSLKSLMAFNTDELLTIEFINGEKLEVITKDADYTVFNFHNIIIGKNEGDTYKFHFDYYDENLNHIEKDEYYGNVQFSIKAAIGLPCTITQVKETEDYKVYLQIGSEPEQETNIFHVNAMTHGWDNINVCFHEVGSSLGLLKITKKVVNSTNPNQTYHFIVFHHATSYKMVKTEFDIKANETYTIQYYFDNIYWNNTNIYIAETNVNSNCNVSYMLNGNTKYTPANMSLEGRIHEDCGYNYDNYKYIKVPITPEQETLNIVCTNEYPTANINLEKKVVSVNPSKEGPFEYEIAVTDSSNKPIDITGIMGQPSEVSMKENTNNVLIATMSGFSNSKLKKTISKIKVPMGSKVTVTESYGKDLDYKVSSSGGDTNNGKTVTINSASNQTITYVNESAVVYQYKVVTDNGENKTLSNIGGNLSGSQEKVYCSTGSISGSSPLANEGYEFKGWYTDAECTQSVYVADSSGKIVPAKNVDDNIYHGGIYYALFTKIPEINGVKLPETGGIGTKPIYLLGTLLLSFGILALSCITIYKYNARKK